MTESYIRVNVFCLTEGKEEIGTVEKCDFVVILMFVLCKDI